MKFMQKLAKRGNDFFNQPAVMFACLGDSVTHGCFEVYTNHLGNIDTRFRPEEGYVSKLRARLNTYCPSAAVSMINAGISGDNATNAATRLERDVLCHHPDLVTVCFGLNDSMNPDVEGGLKQYRESLTKIATDVLASGAECILITPSPMCKYVAGEVPEGILRDVATEAAKVQNEGILARYVEVIREVGKALNIPVADTYATWEAMAEAGIDTTALLSNNINHPIAEAHELFVEAIWQALLH